MKNLGVEFSPRKNLIFGLNGAGKTSVLESIFVIGFGKSFLPVKKSDLVNYDMDSFSIYLDVETVKTENTLSAIYKKNAFSLNLNDKKSNLFEISDHFYPVFFSSANYNRCIDSITILRKMMNRFIFGVRPLYIHYILSYNRNVKQKNHLLKTRRNELELTSWNKSISEMSEKIIHNRVDFIDKLNQVIHERFGNGLSVLYRPSFGIENGFSRDLILQKLDQLQEQEMVHRKSLIGPHLDGYDLMMNSQNLKFYSSGERKLYLMMIYIAFIELVRKARNSYPVFLVDDFDTTFDKKNLDYLIEHYPDIQVIASSVNRYGDFDKLIELTEET